MSSTSPTPLLSIVVPCYNEQAVLEESHRRIGAAARKELGERYELILIDDGSSDETWPMIEALAAADAQVRGVKLSRNHGHQLAVTAGLSLCRGEQVLIIDADLQDPPELLSDMRKMMGRTGADVVYGKRVSRKGETQFKLATASAFYWLLSRNTDVAIPRDTGDFRLMSRRVADLVVAMPEEDRFLRGMITWLGFRQVAYEYERDERFAGETKYPLRSMLKLARSAFMGFSMAPLRMAGQLAIAMFAVMLLIILYAIISWLSGNALPGWTSLIVIVALTSALQLSMMAILGEYIGRIYMASKGRPLFLIDEVREGGDGATAQG